MIVHRRLARASLETPVSDPTDRNTMPMSTLLSSDQWLLETSWDGASIGDVQVFKNAACGHNGVRKTKPGTEKDERGRFIEVPVDDEWVWWAGVPRGKVTSYRFHETEHPSPETVGMPFELTPNAQREEKPKQAGKGGAASA